MKIRSFISAVAACAVAATAFVLPASAEETYTAALTFQTPTYIYRDDLAQGTILYWNADYGEGVEYEGASYVDATITGDGTYTVELNGVVDGGWNMLKVDTTISTDDYPDALITITDVELNGTSVDFDADAAAMSVTTIASGNASDYTFSVANGVRAQLINTYDNVAAIPNDSYESVKVTFEITGLGGSDAGEADASSDASAAATDKGSPDTGVEGIAVVAGVAIVAGGVVLLSKKRK